MSISNGRLRHGSLLIQHTDPKLRSLYPLYSVQTERIKSYEGQWPAYLTQKPEELANAGFFYKGNGDSVHCFFCGGGLRNWERGDDPWIEHARWFKHCKFLRNSMGDEFVNLITENIAQEGQFFSQTYNQGNSQSAGQNSSTHVENVHANKNTFALNVEDLEIDTKPYACESTHAAALPVPSNAEIENVLTMVDFPTEEASASHVAMTESSEHDGNSNEEGATLSSSVTSSTSDDEDKDLVAENKKLKEKTLCKVCYGADFSILFLPCSHLVACAQCAPAMTSCPICRKTITGTTRIRFPAN